MKKRGEYYITQFFYLNLQTLIFIGKMKQLKFLMVALTLLMGISFTSCLNSDDGEYDDIYDMVLVNNYMGLLSFEDAAGNTYQPTPASVTQFEANSSLKISDSRMGIILGKSIEPETNEKSKTTNFTLKNFQPISFANAVVSMTAESLVVDAPETAPVITLKLENGSVQPFLYNKDILLTPIAWRLQNDNDKFKMHKFALACVLDEIEAGATDLVFYLRHDKGADDKTDVYYSNWYGYDIKNALERFKEKAGNLPTKLVIKSHESGNNSNTEIPENYTEYTVEYKIASTNQ